jgi:hypothetical protein
MSFVDPKSNKWKQVWGDSGITVTECIKSVYKDSVMAIWILTKNAARLSESEIQGF